MAKRKTEREIARHEYRNGGFGMNCAQFRRVFPSDWLPGGYLVSNGYYDPTFYTSPVEAKEAWRRCVAAHPSSNNRSAAA
jgi:hypothetical protein